MRCESAGDQSIVQNKWQSEAAISRRRPGIDVVLSCALLFPAVHIYIIIIRRQSRDAARHYYSSQLQTLLQAAA